MQFGSFFFLLRWTFSLDCFYYIPGFFYSVSYLTITKQHTRAMENNELKTIMNGGKYTILLAEGMNVYTTADAWDIFITSVENDLGINAVDLQPAA